MKKHSDLQRFAGTGAGGDDEALALLRGGERLGLMGMQAQRLEAARLVPQPEDVSGGGVHLTARRQFLHRRASLEVRAELEQGFGPVLVVGIDSVDLGADVLGLDPGEGTGEGRVIGDDLVTEVEDVHA